MSPRDIFRVYVSAIRELMNDHEEQLERVAIRPILFLTHILACLVEEHQVLSSLRELEMHQSEELLKRPNS